MKSGQLQKSENRTRRTWNYTQLSRKTRLLPLQVLGENLPFTPPAGSQ
jgi:hypothetical protein